MIITGAITFSRRIESLHFFNWDNGFGIVTAGQTITYDNVGKSVIYKRENDYAKNDSILTLGKAYMQRVFQQYLDY